MKRRLCSLRKMPAMNSRTDKVSRVMVWRALSLALEVCRPADLRSSTLTWAVVLHRVVDFGRRAGSRGRRPAFVRDFVRPV